MDIKQFKPPYTPEQTIELLKILVDGYSAAVLYTDRAFFLEQMQKILNPPIIYKGETCGASE